ncbi:MAG TPA: type II toxin-antitoxin system VapC family toxin, partial [Rhodanobacter sp.]|nr:type II toxin-antitoxin system VapC family toxin [Rhodanobacter sp.]
IVLDTNVLSETLRPRPDARVLAWLASQPVAAVFTSTITRGEILYGVRLLPRGRRRDALQHAVITIFDEAFAKRTLPFDNHAADAFADIAAARQAKGRPISQFDAMIAAVTRSRGATLATRNIKDFSDCGIDLINPWTARRE